MSRQSRDDPRKATDQKGLAERTPGPAVAGTTGAGAVSPIPQWAPSQPDRVRVFIEEHTSNRRCEARVATRPPIRQILPALVSALGLPTTDPIGQRMEYHVSFGDRALLDDETLASAGVHDASVLSLFPDLLPGGPPEQAADPAAPSPATDDLDVTIYRLHEQLALHEGTLRRLLDQLQVHDGAFARFTDRLNEHDAVVAGLDYKVRAAEEDAKSVRDVLQPVRHTRLTINCDAGRRLSFEVAGSTYFRSDTGKDVTFDIDGSNRALLSLRRGEGKQLSRGCSSDWRSTARIEGHRLYQDIFANYPDLNQRFGAARQAATTDDNLTLCFAGPRWQLGAPYELLDDGMPLGVRFPLCKHVSGIDIRNARPFGMLLSELHRASLPLEVLLIAADSRVGADDEILALRRVIEAQAATVKLRASFTVIRAADASHAMVDQELSRCRHHVVHLAAGGVFDAENPDRGGLLVRKDGADYADVLLTPLALARLLRGARTTLFFASADFSAATADRPTMKDNSYLGVLDALVMAGVSNVLGYRWPVNPAGARLFAEHFYRGLFSTQSPARAALAARSAIHVANPNDDTWASAVLVSDPT